MLDCPRSRQGEIRG